MYEPCVFCGRTDALPDETCPWGCAFRENTQPQQFPRTDGRTDHPALRRQITAWLKKFAGHHDPG